MCIVFSLCCRFSLSGHLICLSWSPHLLVLRQDTTNPLGTPPLSQPPPLPSPIRDRRHGNTPKNLEDKSSRLLSPTLVRCLWQGSHQ
ncbi:hypothetical protein E2C01_090854 [Portunus trituberculatus]|uniref:Uncharacterized protein n=1 Tax=Portunus trituberculatus TaxID=210409 RepID=A0A5B7JM07_PORTR|nr:hypothetical protein [Portunus trituberculatus]